MTNAPLKFQSIVDDGAVFYVNETEVLRLGMPPGVITNGTLATRTMGNDQFWEDAIPINPAAFVEGTNLVAVEVHQGSSTSADIAFALRLVGTMQTVPAQPRILRVALDARGHLIIEHNGSWSGYPFYVQEAAALALDPTATVWNTRPGGPHVSPYDAGPATGTRFFRLSDSSTAKPLKVAR